MNFNSINLLKKYSEGKNLLKSELGFLEGSWTGSGEIENHKVFSLLTVKWQDQFLVWSSKSVSEKLKKNNPSNPQIPDWELEQSELIVFQGLPEKKIIHMHVRDKNKWDPKNLKFKEIFLRLSLKKTAKEFLFEPVEKNKFEKNFFTKINANHEKIIFKNSNGTRLAYFRNEKI